MGRSAVRAAVALALALGAAACTRPEPRPAGEVAKGALTVSSVFGRATSVVAGNTHSCALIGSGQVVCWGIGAAGELGTGSTTDSSLPVAVVGLTDAVSIAAGAAHTCAVRANGNVVCWGQGDLGQLGNGTAAGSSVPIEVVGLTEAKSLAAGTYHTCAVRTNGTVACWGFGLDGQLGSESSDLHSLPVPVAGLSDAVQIAAGYDHTCAVRESGAVVCWGRNNAGQLGNGTTSIGSWEPRDVVGLSDVESISAGGEQTCVVRTSGQVVCWGTGRMGNGSTAPSAVPVAVTGLEDATAVSVSALLNTDIPTQICAARRSGEVVCWGDEIFIEYFWTSPASLVPVAVPGVSDAVSVAAGGMHSCALRANGQIACWGYGPEGELGNGHDFNVTEPVGVTGVVDARALGAGGSDSCAVRESGEVVCWGYSTGPAPTPVVDLSGATEVAVGNSHACAIRGAGEVACWGENEEGQLGDGTASATSGLVVVPGLADVVSITTGTYHSCAIRQTGAVVCWGSNGYGAMGYTGVLGPSGPVAVPGLTDAVSIAAGVHHTCVVRRDGHVVCWGYSPNGQLGNGAPFSSDTPVTVSGLDDAIAIASGGFSFHTCAVRSNGAVACWGEGTSGQLGNGGTASSSVPVPVTGLTDAVSIAGDHSGSCARRAGGEVVCWGGVVTLPSGGISWLSVPVAVTGLSDAEAIAMGGAHRCALRAGGAVVCWGNDGAGQIGNGSPWKSNVPSQVLRLADPACTSDTECGSGFCVDGVCCSTACGGSDASDCQACSVAAGGTVDGRCTLKQPGTVCGLSSGACDLAATCTGTSPSCPANDVATAGTPCYTAAGFCETDAACSGSGPVCPSHDLPADRCVAMTTNTVSLLGGLGAVGGISLTFPSTWVGGSVKVSAPATGCPAPTGFQFLYSSQLPTSGRIWNIDTDPPTGYPIPARMCVHYAASWVVGSENNLRLIHGTSAPDPTTCVGAGWTTLPGMAICKSNGCYANTGPGTALPCDTCSSLSTICGNTSSFSPFALVEPLAASVPSVTVPGHVVASASNAAGVPVSFAAGASDQEDGSLVPRCVPASGSSFSPGTTTVVCTATDSDGLTASASFDVTVTLAPRDTVPPVFSGVPATTIAYATSTAGAKVTFTKPTARDAVDGGRPVTCTSASGATFPLGKTTVSCSATDASGNSATATFVVWVQVQAPGDGTFFLVPIRANGSSVFRIGRPVPVRFRLTGASAGITNLTAKLTVTKVSSTVQGTADDASDETVDDTDLTFKYRPLLKWYAYRWRTTDQTRGTFKLKADLGDGVTHEIVVSLEP